MIFVAIGVLSVCLWQGSKEQRVRVQERTAGIAGRGARDPRHCRAYAGGAPAPTAGVAATAAGMPDGNPSDGMSEG